MSASHWVSHQIFPSIHFQGTTSRLLNTAVSGISEAIKKLPELIHSGFPRSSALWRAPLIDKRFSKCGPGTACIRISQDPLKMLIPWLVPDFWSLALHRVEPRNLNFDELLRSVSLQWKICDRATFLPYPCPTSCSDSRTERNRRENLWRTKTWLLTEPSSHLVSWNY